MTHKWSLTAVTAVVLLATACSSGKGGTSSAQGREHASDARKTTAEVYWKLYHSISAPAVESGGSGAFTRCGNNRSKSASYVVKAVLGTRDKRATPESLTQAVANQLSSAGWHLSPATGLKRSVTKDDITLWVQPPRFVGSDTMTTFQVEGKCVDLGSAAYSIFNDYAQQTDQYSSSDPSKSPIPTTFPSPIG